ncbi:unnamed protein product [Medioppia subpectinata]|uniref:C2H2-type domain-containing protein n=1 Tax=Medioppia subpectinata TaxID=1979941 RepID=A0A7R9KKC3_9ACAR|nr:unnamed protein product [Medioppia subpectinata]CAG2105023.1 unnamed protein product [Medioppia subpectinata]
MVGKDEDNRFNCPIDGCVYGLSGDKHFKRKLFLTQHIANKHSEKKFSCEKCHKKYAIEWQLKYHEKSCGLQWRCGSCPKSYTERLSLIMHCKRHSHVLSPNDCIKKCKTDPKATPINVQLVTIVLPLIVDSNNANQRPVNILPKSDHILDSMSVRSDSTQTNAIEECKKCKMKSPVKHMQTNAKKYQSISIQTDQRLNHKSSKYRESRSTDCQTIRKRNRKPQLNNNFESIETQTLESALHAKQVSNRIQISASTSTTPPKRAKRNRLDVNTSAVNEVKSKSCAFTQTTDPSIASTSLDLFDFNPLLSEMNTTNAILEQSVQTEAIDVSFVHEFNNIETQTVNQDLNADDFDNLCTDEDLDLFKIFEFADIETQTIWNNDRTTQTDEHLDQINDVILRYLDNESECDISGTTLFTSTQTQTQTEFPLLNSSAIQISHNYD